MFFTSCVYANHTSQAKVYETSFQSAIVEAADKNQESEVERLLQSGTSVNTKGAFQTTALMRAAFNGNFNLAKTLIGNGADVNASDVGGATALHIAVRRGNNAIVDLLLKSGAIYTKKDQEGFSAEDRARAMRNNKAAELIATFDRTKGLSALPPLQFAQAQPQSAPQIIEPEAQITEIHENPSPLPPIEDVKVIAAQLPTKHKPEHKEQSPKITFTLKDDDQPEKATEVLGVRSESENNVILSDEDEPTFFERLFNSPKDVDDIKDVVVIDKDNKNNAMHNVIRDEKNNTVVTVVGERDFHTEPSSIEKLVIEQTPVTIGTTMGATTEVSEQQMEAMADAISNEIADTTPSSKSAQPQAEATNHVNEVSEQQMEMDAQAVNSYEEHLKQGVVILDAPKSLVAPSKNITIIPVIEEPAHEPKVTEDSNQYPAETVLAPQIPFGINLSGFNTVESANRTLASIANNKKFKNLKWRIDDSNLEKIKINILKFRSEEDAEKACNILRVNHNISICEMVALD